MPGGGNRPRSFLVISSGETYFTLGTYFVGYPE